MKVDKTNAFDLRGNPYELKKRSTKASGEEKNLFLETRKRAIFQAKPIKKGMIKTGICFSGSKPWSLAQAEEKPVEKDTRNKILFPAQIHGPIPPSAKEQNYWWIEPPLKC